MYFSAFFFARPIFVLYVSVHPVSFLTRQKRVSIRLHIASAFGNSTTYRISTPYMRYQLDGNTYVLERNLKNYAHTKSSIQNAKSEKGFTLRKVEWNLSSTTTLIWHNFVVANDRWSQKGRLNKVQTLTWCQLQRSANSDWSENGGPVDDKSYRKILCTTLFRIYKALSKSIPLFILTCVILTQLHARSVS